MYLKSSLFPFLFLSFFLLFSSAAAFNVTKILGEHSDFSALNGYITDTQLAGEINNRQSLTILAVDNGGLSSLSGKPKDVIKKILSLHVLLDYFDLPKLQKIPNNTQILPTLFQASGQATGQLGFLNVTHLSSGGVEFGSAVNGSQLGANVVKSIFSQPFNLSVLQISSPIVPPGITNSTASTSPASPPTPPPSPPPPSSAPAPESSPSNKSAPAPTPAKAPPPANASSPSNGTSPAMSPPPSDSPSESPPPKASPPSPTKRPFLGPVADVAPAGSPKTSKEGGKDSSAPAMAGLQVAVFTVVVSSLSSLISYI